MSSYLDKHRAYMNTYGNSVAEQRSNSTMNFISSKFQDSPFYKVVQINGVDKGVRIEDMTSIVRSNNFNDILFDNKYMFLQPNDTCNMGDYVLFDSVNWMVTDYNAHDPIYPKAKIERCNNSIIVVTGNTEVVTGYDTMGRPIMSGNELTDTLPCIVKDHNGNGRFNNDISAPSDRIGITVQYNSTGKEIGEDDEYTFYNRTYKVVSIDFSKVYNDVGFISLNAIRVVT